MFTDVAATPLQAENMGRLTLHRIQVGRKNPEDEKFAPFSRTGKTRVNVGCVRLKVIWPCMTLTSVLVFPSEVALSEAETEAKPALTRLRS